MNIPWLEPDSPLPAPELAQKNGSALEGLVAAGGGLSVGRLCEAYQQGMFPWFSQGQPVLWWSPDPRMVLQTADFKLHRSFRKTLHSFIMDDQCEIRINHDFSAVIRHCAQASRKGKPGTWIVEEMILAYEALHAQGLAHTVETWQDNRLVGGLYCVSMGDTLFGESMFALQTDASKIALAALVAFARHHELAWIDCQQNTAHLASLGAREMPRMKFLKLVREARKDVSRAWLFQPEYWQTLLLDKATK
ncbi:leucyl/phenylalanyl-tRNA--protein transferase [Limnohabitans sp.]|uniref:leucyl/phenylalanyl-tRNA--protein transferase n=1 Tax=Limnohabitans sp. TaxID=1907725 RepID=UPI002FDD651D